MELLGQQRDSLGQREQFIRTPELLAKLVDRSVLLFGMGKVSDQSHRTEKSAKGVIESSGVDLRRESQWLVVLRGFPSQGQFNSAGAPRSGAAFVEAKPSH